MALPTGEDLKTYLRIEHDAEDALCDDLIESAKAQAESLINRPILATAKTFSNLRPIVNEFGRSVIYLPEYPVAADPAIVVKDENALTVDAGDYLYADSGRITANSDVSFDAWPYEITATVGLALASDYATRIEPMLRVLILGIAAILYRQRNPNATSDSSGAGVSVSYSMNGDSDGLPPHLYSIVRKLRPVRVA